MVFGLSLWHQPSLTPFDQLRRTSAREDFLRLAQDKLTTDLTVKFSSSQLFYKQQPTSKPCPLDFRLWSLGFLYGTPGRTRTSDLRLRRPMLYPTELRTHFASFLDAQVQGPECSMVFPLVFGLWALGSFGRRRYYSLPDLLSRTAVILSLELNFDLIEI